MKCNFYTKEDVAKLLRVHLMTVSREIARGKLDIHKFGDRVLISESQLESYLKLCRHNSKRKTIDDSNADKHLSVTDSEEDSKP